MAARPPSENGNDGPVNRHIEGDMRRVQVCPL